MAALDPHIFRAYDIRGKALTQLTEEAARLIGRGFGSVLRELYGTDHPRVAVGRDARTHGPVLEHAVIDGLTSVGCMVERIGMTSSPVSYFTVVNRTLDGSVQVTASHNPKEDNGLKLQIRDAEAYAGDDLQSLRKRIEENAFAAPSAGNVSDLDAITPYLEHLSKLFGRCAEELTVILDGGNGVAGPTYLEALLQAGARVKGLFIEPDGEFPNHPADPSKHATLRDLQEEVKRGKASCGIAFDGDGDRVGLVDEKGNIVSADEILLLLAEDHLSRKKGAPVVFTVSNSGVLESEITRLGGKPVMCKVGHSFVEHAMREHGALLGGEQSGHFFCGEDYFGYDDALVAALRILRILKEKQKPLSQLLQSFPKAYQLPEYRPFCPDDRKSAIVQELTTFFAKDHPVLTLDGARIDFGDGAWAGIRQSNTSPRLSIIVEARSTEKLEEVKTAVFGALAAYPEVREEE